MRKRAQGPAAGLPLPPSLPSRRRCAAPSRPRGIAHGDVYAHNVMADEAGQATLCDYGASFPYRKGGPVPYEAHEVGEVQLGRSGLY